MEDGVAVFTVVFLIRLSVHLSSADTHSLQYHYTVITPVKHFPESTVIGLVDGEQFVYYDSNISNIILKTEWIQTINTSDPHYWKRGLIHMQRHQKWNRDIVTSVMQKANQAEGDHVLQLMYGCQRDDDNTTTSYMTFGYNGEDFFHLDLNTGNWTTDKHQAEIIIKDWDPKWYEAKQWRFDLQNACFDWLNKVVSYGKDVLERKVRPEVSLFQKHSSSLEVVCHSTGFFPKALMITWQKDGEDVYEDVDLRETLPNQDGSFQKRSILKVSAEELQNHKYTCVIQHSSLEEGLGLPVSERRILRGD